MAIIMNVLLYASSTDIETINLFRRVNPGPIFDQGESLCQL